MRKILPCFNLSKNIKYDLKACNHFGLNRSYKMSIISGNNYSALRRQYAFNFSTTSDVEVEKAKLIVPFKGYLTIRNS